MQNLKCVKNEATGEWIVTYGETVTGPFQMEVDARLYICEILRDIRAARQQRENRAN